MIKDWWLLNCVLSQAQKNKLQEDLPEPLEQAFLSEGH
jgi:hypothetical protein